MMLILRGYVQMAYQDMFSFSDCQMNKGVVFKSCANHTVMSITYYIQEMFSFNMQLDLS